MTTENSYTQCTMNSTDVYNYMKRMARMNSNETIDCLAEALIQSYGDDTGIDTRNLKTICAKYMTDLDFRTMECNVVTSMRSISFDEAHVD
jgi:hypothetical protein